MHLCLLLLLLCLSTNVNKHEKRKSHLILYELYTKDMKKKRKNLSFFQCNKAPLPRTHLLPSTYIFISHLVALSIVKIGRHNFLFIFPLSTPKRYLLSFSRINRFTKQKNMTNNRLFLRQWKLLSASSVAE